MILIYNPAKLIHIKKKCALKIFVALIVIYRALHMRAGCVTSNFACLRQPTRPQRGKNAGAARAREKEVTHAPPKYPNWLYRCRCRGHRKKIIVFYEFEISQKAREKERERERERESSRKVRK